MQARRTRDPARGRCKYTQSNSHVGDIKDALEIVAANISHCTRFYLDTVESMSSGGEDHHQGLARTHRLSDGRSLSWCILTSIRVRGSCRSIAIPGR
jgi:hypothetical protein